MSSAADDLYQELILDHGRRPRNFRRLDGPVRSAEGHNPLCGDRVTVFVRVEDGVVKELSFLGAGCAISTASASLMTETARGKTEDELEALFQRFHDLVTGHATGAHADGKALGKLAAFRGVSEFPVRVKCATLPWHTLRAAIENRTAPVTTE